MKLRTFWVILAAMAVIRLALMATVPVFEPSEARYAAISANMARSGDFVVPHFTHNLEYQSFDGKPPLVFQAGGLFCELFGVNEFAVRLFPFLSALLLLVILYHAVRKFSDSATGRLAVLVCMSCTAFYAASGICMTDMTLTCCVAGALLLYRCFLDGFAWKYAAGVMALMGAGMIVKGPVALVMFGLPVFVDALVNRRWPGIFNWKWLATAPLFFLIAVPWFVFVEQRNPGAVWYFFYNENFMRFISHDYGDKYGAGREAFRGVSILWALVATLPWALIPLWDLICHFRKSNIRTFEHSNISWRSFPVVAFLSIVGFWCLTSRVLIYYLFPVIPLFAAGIALEGDRVVLRKMMPWCVGVSCVVLVGALVGGTFFSDKMRGAKTEMHPLENHYAYEFYHGRKSDEELAKYVKVRDEYLRCRAERRAREAAERAKEAEK